MPHDRLLVLAYEDAIGGGAVEVIPGGEDFTHSFHKMISKHMILPFPVLVLRLRLKAAKFASEMGSNPLIIFWQ